ncbi:MAG TPA: sigma-70 family RNA polymerase sigma factor [Polyangia bacterium]|jgi:RNA polymerase sigma-70 factor (ECF subfamily)|nr:sigma-70 family RNA polymerase sigma factor [Polyangia bacterium]
MIRSLVLQNDVAALPRPRTVTVVGGERTEIVIQWLDRFHAGERPVMEEVYRAHFRTVDGAIGGVMSGADRETATHEVFFRLINNDNLRRSFRGGDLGAWLAVVSRNHAIDYVRRRNRESPAGIDLAQSSGESGMGRRAEARLLIERFLRDILPPQWHGVFEARMLQSLSQAQAAATLGISRTTLAYRELRIRLMLQKFLLEDAA